MMKITHIGSTLFVLVACASPASPTGVSIASATTCSSGICVSEPPIVAGACRPDRQITFGAGFGDCPNATGWTKAKLFPGAIVLELADYCVYDFNGSGLPGKNALARLPANHAPDCNVVVAQGSAWEQVNAPAYEAAYLAQIESLTSLPLVNQLQPVSGKVLVVDSAVTGNFPAPMTGQLEHGQVMGEIVRKLGCPGSGPCRAAVATRLALALERDPVSGELEPNLAQGGYLGRLSALAAAIVSGVDYGFSQGGPVVINLSLGWDGYWGGDLGSLSSWQALPAPVRAVYSAIAYAGCRGALVVAASGNGPDGPQLSYGAAYPAAWESEPAPDSSRCWDLGGQTITPGTGYEPFLHAVGAVGGKDETLLSERPGSRPRIVAPADHVSMTRTVGPHSGAQTGTSVAAAGVSAIAATVWSYLPAQSPHEVMDIVYASSVPLGLQVELCNGACASQAKRASMCRAVRRACQVRGDCNPMPECGPSNPGRDARVSNLVFNNPLPDSLPYSPVFTQTFVGEPCNVDIISTEASTLANPCPSRQYFSRYAAPHLVPQPIIYECPGCGVHMASRTLFAGIADDAPPNLSDPKLRLVDPTGTEVLIDLPDIGSGDLRGLEFKIANLPIDLVDVEKASLEFVVNGDLSSSSPISVY